MRSPSSDAGREALNEPDHSVQSPRYGSRMALHPEERCHATRHHAATRWRLRSMVAADQQLRGSFAVQADLGT
jgi:hypothetical protein